MQYYPLIEQPVSDPAASTRRTVLEPVAIDCDFGAEVGADGWQRVLGRGACRPGIAFPAMFLVGHITTLCVSLRPSAGQIIRIEAHGLTARMGKAVATFTAGGEVLSCAEEVTKLTVLPQQDGTLQIRFAFLPYRSRREAWFLFIEGEDFGANGEMLFDLAQAVMETCPVAPKVTVSQDHMAAVNLGDIWMACQHMAFFRNSLHLEFEVYKPGARLAGLSLHSPLPLGPVQWWTPDAERITPTTSELRPSLPAHPLPAPAMLDRFGPEVDCAGHVICALFADYANFERLPIDVTDGARDLILTLRFTDGTVRRVSLQKVINAQSNTPDARLRVEAALTDLRESLGQAGIFLEVGARGPASTAMRQLRQAAWHYIGVDYQADANVDFVVDAHCISKHFAEASVDVIYSAEVMEHLLSPLTFVLEANRILKDGGLFVASVPTIWPLHAEPWDYWRFTSHSWKGLLNQNTGFELLYLAETSAASVVPRLPSLSGLTRMQQNPAPMQSLVLARRIGPAQPGTTGWIPGLEGGQYDHA